MVGHLAVPLVVILSAFVACASPEDPVAPAPAEPPFTVTGLVYDSLAATVGSEQAAAGVRVSVNGVVDFTDSVGRFTVTRVRGGPVATVELLSQRYEPATLTVSIDRGVTRNLALRRLAPLITGFFPAGDSTRITVVDLQNRKTVERWQRTRALMSNRTTQWSQVGIQWIWTPVDSITWLVSIPSTTGAEDFQFDVYDVTGASSHAVCRLDHGCDHLWPPEGDPQS